MMPWQERDKRGICRLFQTLLSATVIAMEVLLRARYEVVGIWAVMFGLTGPDPSWAGLLPLWATSPGWAPCLHSAPTAFLPRLPRSPEEMSRQWGLGGGSCAERGFPRPWEFINHFWSSQKIINIHRGFFPRPQTGIFRVGQIRRKQPSVFHDPQQKLHDELVTEEPLALTFVALFLI